MDEWLRPEDVARELKISPHTITRWCRTGKLEAQKLEVHWRFKRSALEKFLAERNQQAKKVDGLVFAH